MMSPAELQAAIAREIPALGRFPFQVLDVRVDSIRIGGRLHDHRNHKGTAFGGSLYEIALLACYGLFFSILESRGFSTREIVIASGEIRYRAPVNDDFESHCEISPPTLEDFLWKMKSTGQADLQMTSHVTCQGRTCARFEARFVARQEIRA